MDFKKKTLDSFASLRDDMDRFQDSMNDWIIFLDGELRDSKTQIKELQKRISELEMEKRLRF